MVGKPEPEEFPVGAGASKGRTKSGFALVARLADGSAQGSLLDAADEPSGDVATRWRHAIEGRGLGCYRLQQCPRPATRKVWSGAATRRNVSPLSSGYRLPCPNDREGCRKGCASLESGLEIAELSRSRRHRSSTFRSARTSTANPRRAEALHQSGILGRDSHPRQCPGLLLRLADPPRPKKIHFHRGQFGLPGVTLRRLPSS